VHYATLGASGMNVSRVCLGTMTFGRPIEETQCARLVSLALDRGINFIDTANVYEGYARTFGSCGGLAEEILGKALAGRRQEAVICTKFANPVGLGPLQAGLSDRHLEMELDKSLRRLRTDWIDLVLAHRVDAGVPVDEVWRVFERWVRMGKVRAVGVSNWPAWRLAQASEIGARNGWPPVCVSSPKYNLLHREIELEHVPCALAYSTALVTYQPFEGGLLTGKYRRGRPAPENSRGAELPAWMPMPADAIFDRLEGLECLALEAGASLPEYVLAWLLSRPGVTAVVAGCRGAEQLEDLLRSTDRRIPEEHLAKIDALFPPPQATAAQQVLGWKNGAWGQSSSAG
jgi:L-glyceraldehyde 3-phosphate reductase